MSGGSSTNNSWTILTPEETAAETLRPLAEATEHHEESLTSAAGSGENQPASGAESADGLPVEGQLISEERTAELSEDRSTEQHSSVPTAISDAPAPASLEVPGSLVPGSDALSQSEGLPEGLVQSSPDPDSFSDSYTHMTPSPDEPPAKSLSTETLGGVEFTQEEERLAQEGTLHPLNGEGLQQEEEESDLSHRTTDIGKQADSPVDPEAGEDQTEKTGEEGEPEVRRRRSLLAALERIGRTEEEEEEEGEEEFQLPQREEDSGFSVNKCILGAVILLGLGTIFFSGVFMDLDEESDYGTRELKDAELPGKQEWLNPEVPPPPVDADSTELLDKLAKGSQQISVLQAQLQAQKEELKVAEGQAAEGAKERLQWEEVEKENSRLKKEVASLPVLQKENERMKRELESVPALQKELETLRSTVTELKLSSAAGEAAQAPVKPAASPPSGQPEDSMQGTAGSTESQPRRKEKDLKKDMGEKKEWREREKSEWKAGEKRERKEGGKTEWKKEKPEQGKFDKVKDKEGKHKKQSDEKKEWKEKDRKKDKASRGDEGKPWKDREGKKEKIEKSERKEWKVGKDWKKGKHEQPNEAKQWRGKEEKKNWKVGKDHEEKHKGKEQWKGEREWKKGKDDFKDSGKEKWEKKGWREKGEKKEWKKESDWKSKNGKDHSKEKQGKGERKQWEESKDRGKERKVKDERKQWNENEWKSRNGKDDKEWKKKDDHGKKGGQKEKKSNGDWNRDRSSSQKHKEEHKFTGNHGHGEEHLWGEGKSPHTHRRPTLEQPEYWVQQRDRLQHNPKPPQQCDSVETCAQAEGLLPVRLPDFEAVLQTYLAKAEEVGVDAAKREELKKLATEFFKDGVFVHNQMSFKEFAEDLGDVLEDMVEGDDDEEEEEESAIEEEMEGFEREVMKKFSVPGAAEKEERSKGEWRKESGRGRG